MKAPKIGDEKDDKKKVRNARADKHLRKPQRLSDTTLRVNKKQGLMGSLVSVLTPRGEGCDEAFDWALSLLSMKRSVEVLQVVGNRANFEDQILTVLLTEIGRSVRSLWVTGCKPQARNQWSTASQA
ncbi:hypothetical protein CCUS01_01453 [Colletotrichum cuscutae]|uniref:Uncharacterized protein n=1 Tax=Colletotrichum cuscutae TaxID=1209917 RepID=A0AAI9UTN0_9PEZI|nr:hypothetical protein CCUS01_01453 [Colletotrichum cuscutae]